MHWPRADSTHVGCGEVGGADVVVGELGGGFDVEWVVELTGPGAPTVAEPVG